MFLKRILKLQFFCIATFILSFNSSLFAQGTSNKGTDFWVAYTAHLDGMASTLTLFITSQVNTTVTINAGGTVLPKVSVTANQAQTVFINPNVYKNVYIGGSEVIETKKGIHITSDKDIIVYSHISCSFRSAATLVFPTKVLGSDYYTIHYTQSSRSDAIGYSQFTIVGVEDATDIEIIPAHTSTTTLHKAGVPFTIKLNKGDVYQFQSSTDLSGSRIRTLNGCMPVAVFSGSSFTYFCESTNPSNAGTGDNLYQQLLPISAWGKNFVTAPFYNALHGSTDIYRIVVANDNTTITVNGIAGATRHAKGNVLTFNSKGANVISADKPISVAQFQTTQGCNINNQQGFTPYPGDPEMTILNPIEQTLKDVIVYSAVPNSQAITQISSHFINIIIKTADASSLKIDGSAFPAKEFESINSGYSYLIADVTRSSNRNPTHRIIAAGGFAAIAYGYGRQESYGYLAGSDLKNLKQFIEARDLVKNQVVTLGQAGSSYKFVLQLGYITNSLVWDFGNGNVYTDPTPKYTVEKSSDATIYKYEYNGSYKTAGNYKFKVHAINPAPSGCDAEEIIDFDFTVSSPPTVSKSETIVPTPKAIVPVPAPIPKAIVPVPPATPKAFTVEGKPLQVKITPKPAVSASDAYTSFEIWDSDCMDFDSVSLKLNGKQIGPKSIAIQLYRRYGSPEFTYALDLQPGDNTLEIYALNEGVNPFNTVGIMLMNEKKRKRIFFKLKARESIVIHLLK